MPMQKPGKSRQDFPTPDDFIQAFIQRFGPISYDLAADDTNTKCPSGWFDKVNDSLERDWHKLPGNLWLNPPYEKIEPWAFKCAEESRFGAKIFMLVPASIGSNWYRDYVEPYAYTLALNPRLSFDGKHPYPKDCLLACYLHGFTGFQTWEWK